MSLRLRGGGAEPPVTETYGPTSGGDGQTVRDNTGPRVVLDPGGGVSFTSATDIQALIAANPSNSIFVASATGTYTNFRGIDWTVKHPRFYFPGLASAYSITGTGSGNVIGVGVATSEPYTGEIHGGTWTAYGDSSSELWMRAINGVDLIEDAIVTANGQIGIAIGGASGVARRCAFTSNGRYGIVGQGSSSSYISPTVEYCYVALNNVNRTSAALTESDAGGQKFGYTDGGIWRYNWFYGNHAWGLWLDGPQHDALIEENVCEANLFSGIFYEIGNGGVVIQHNAVIGNGLCDAVNTLNWGVNNGNLHVSNAACDGTGVGGGPNVAGEIRYNLVDASDNATGIMLVDHVGHATPNNTRNWTVHDNLIRHRGASGQGRSGLVDLHNENLITLPAAKNYFDLNEYRVLTPGGNYYEADGSYTFVQFQARGYEAFGTEAAI